MTAQAEGQALAGSALVELYVLDLTRVAPDLAEADRVLRFANELNELGEPILWNGYRYPAVPIESDGWSLTGRGPLPRPHVRISNIGGSLSAFCRAYDDLVGAKLTRQRTFARFLPAENFRDGNPFADGAQRLPDDVYQIRQKLSDTPQFVEWELGWPGDLQGVQLPRNVVLENVCSWRYKGAECGWVPGAGPYFDTENRPCAAAQDECSLSLAGCELRFVGRGGREAILPARIFPGARIPKA